MCSKNIYLLSGEPVFGIRKFVGLPDRIHNYLNESSSETFHHQAKNLEKKIDSFSSELQTSLLLVIFED
jgi:hypothetical protein